MNFNYVMEPFGEFCGNNKNRRPTAVFSASATRVKTMAVHTGRKSEAV